MLSTLLYSSKTKGAGERVQKVIEAQIPSKKIEIYRTIESLSHRLCQPTYSLNIAVLFAATSEDLSEILSIRDLLSRIRIILILPDQERITTAKGHRLYPRFISYIDSNFQDVAAVLGKMLNIQP